MGVLIALMGVEQATAQIRLIDQAKIDSVRNPQVVERSPLQIIGGTIIPLGSIEEDASPWMRELQWKNQGASPLVITKVVTTCGCFKVDYDRRPVAADSLSVLRLEYHPKGHPGAVYQRAMIYTNAAADRPTVIVTLSGEVIAAPDMQVLYPHTCGPLRMRTAQATFRSNGGRQEMNIACYNGGNEPLRITTDTLLTSPSLRLHTMPRELKPGERGDLVVTFDPAKAIFIRPTMLLYMGGIHVAPRQRQLMVVVK